MLALAIGTPMVGEPDRTYIKSEIDNVVFLETEVGRCTGSIIAKNLFLTAAHCVEGQTKAWAMFDDGKWTELDVLYVGKPGSREDVALLSGDSRGVAPAVLASKSPELEEGCFFFGFAGTKTEMMMPCFLTTDLGPWGIVGRGESRPGDSGGPVFGKNGQLIGVIWGGSQDDPFDMIIAPVETVLEALRKIKK